MMGTRHHSQTVLAVNSEVLVSPRQIVAVVVAAAAVVQEALHDEQNLVNEFASSVWW